MGIKNMTLSEIEAHMHAGTLELTQEEMLHIINHILDVMDKHYINKFKGEKFGEINK